jgi:hypothetical protein
VEEKEGGTGDEADGSVENIRLKPLQLCIVKIQNLLKVIKTNLLKHLWLTEVAQRINQMYSTL